jgi:tetratricopeptide (TPR) repeat protein
MIFSGDKGEEKLAKRLLAASRFHPLLMDRLARLATGGAALRPQLMQALEALEKSHDYTQLPSLFAARPGDARELEYLDDALATSLDQLIDNAGPDARRLLWIIAVANDPVALGLLRGVWGGESFEDEKLRGLKQMLEMLPQLPPRLQEELRAMPPEVRARVDALPPAPVRPDLGPLVRRLAAVGLVTEERTGPDDDNPGLTCHELVRERIRAWMHERPQDRADLTENAIRLAYAERLEAFFRAFRHQDMAPALQAGSRALVYYIQAGAYDRLGDFASWLVTSTRDPRLLAGLLPHLEAAAESASEGRPRWTCLGNMANALGNAGRHDASLPFFEQAAAQARAAAEAGGENGRQAWSDLGAITGNWAIALLDVGDLGGSRQRHLESAAAKRTAGRPSVDVIGSELEALRIDIRQRRVAEALPEVETRLARVEAWWQRHQSGERVLEAPDPEPLARTLIGALNIARQAYSAQKDWEQALRRADASLKVKRWLRRPAQDIAMDRMNRANVLRSLGRSAEARAELEDCLEVFRDDPAGSARTLGSLASLFDEQGDVREAIVQQRRVLAMCEQLPDPRDRAISHNNLAKYLKRSGTPAALAESTRHCLAALIYHFASGLGQDLQTLLCNHATRLGRARAASTELAVPRVAELLADPAFRPLADWLRQRQANLDEVQALVDQVLEAARQAAEQG